MELPKKDTSIYEETNFIFNEAVAAVFDDMAARSIPGYFTTQQLSMSLAKRCVVKDSAVYDIGSATGTTLIALARAFAHKNVQAIGIEPSKAMREICLKRAIDNDISNIELCPLLAEEIEPHNASLVLLNYTLHFTPPEKRPQILKTYYENLILGGVLVLAEKITVKDDAAAVRTAYHRFKELNGYSREEILSKERALEGVLQPFSKEENMILLRQAGFRTIEVAFETAPFCTFVAFK